MKKMDLSNVQDIGARENFRRLDDEFNQNPFLLGTMKLFVLEFNQAGTFEVFHKLGFTPVDLLQTFASSPVTYNYNVFNEKKISITTTGATKIRFLLGRLV